MQVKRTLISLAAMLILLIGLAGCGATTSATQPGSSGTGSTPSATLNGCPTQHIPVDVRPGSNQVVVTNVGAQDQTVTVAVGATLAIQLPANWHWGAHLTDSNGILGELQPEGFYNSQLKVCIWNYAAKTAGTATITFAGTPVCAAGQVCSAIAKAQTYEVTVK